MDGAIEIGCAWLWLGYTETDYTCHMGFCCMAAGHLDYAVSLLGLV
jgi:hypothetical protein